MFFTKWMREVCCHKNRYLTLPPVNPLKFYPMKSIVLAILAASSLAVQAKSLKIYLMAGQSNMTGMVKTSTLEHVKMFPDTAKEYADMFDANGKPIELKQVQVSCWPKKEGEAKGDLKPGYGGGTAGEMFGPEYAFGVYMYKKLQQPILIIKCGQGGRNLFFNFRPPSAGEWTPPPGHPDVTNPSKFKALEVKADPNNPKTIVSYEYKKMIDHTRKVLSDLKSYYPGYDEKDGYEISGFVWFQGWNDMIDGKVYPNKGKLGGYDQYTWLLENLIRDVRKDLNAPKMSAVIGVMGIEGIQDPKTPGMGTFQAAQAAVAEKPEFKGNVAATQTGKFWDSHLADLYKRHILLHNPKKPAPEGTKPLTPEEENLVKIGTSEAEYHYLGSAKIMVGLGKGMAESMLELEAKRR